jgi:uncharacterized protein (DUF2141 family)
MYIFILFFLLILKPEIETKTLIVNVKNTKNRGTVRVGIYTDPAVFLEVGKQKYWQIGPTSSTGVFKARFSISSEKVVAVAVYNDVNDNKKIDTNIFGYPTEPFGFSNNYKPKIRGPKFEECKVVLNKPETEINIDLL